MTKSKISEKLKKAVRERGLTQKELAKFLNVKQGQISRFLSGENQIPLDKFEKLLGLLGKDANYFFDNSGTIHGDVAINSSIKKSNNPTSDYQHLLKRVEKLEKITKNKNKSK